MNNNEENVVKTISIRCPTCKSESFEVSFFLNIDTNADGMVLFCPNCKVPIFKSKLGERLSDLIPLPEEDK